MTTSEIAFVDSNVLIYAALQDSPHFAAASALREAALTGAIRLCFTPQILAEFFAVITDPRRVSQSRTVEEALREMEKYIAARGFSLLSTPAEAVPQMITLCRHHPVRAQEIFDLQIVAAMVSHGIRTIYTFNASDFQQFDEIKVVVP